MQYMISYHFMPQNTIQKLPIIPSLPRTQSVPQNRVHKSQNVLQFQPTPRILDETKYTNDNHGHHVEPFNQPILTNSGTARFKVMFLFVSTFAMVQVFLGISLSRIQDLSSLPSSGSRTYSIWAITGPGHCLKGSV